MIYAPKCETWVKLVEGASREPFDKLRAGTVERASAAPAGGLTDLKLNARAI
jgi:hypothetical protein